jgi:hypothetical protein
MAINRPAVVAVPGAAAALLWPALWNGYPIVFADTGTYLSQAIHRYAGWDRPVFYSLFLLPLHGTVTLWPVVAAQALLTAWIVWLICRVLVPGLSAVSFVSGVAVLSACTWLPWIVCEVMPDVFTPLLVLVIGLLTWMPQRLSHREQVILVALATFMIASQQSSLPLACVLFAVLATLRFWPPSSLPGRGDAKHQSALAAVMLPGSSSTHDDPRGSRRGWLLIALPPTLAIIGLCTVNLAAHGRLAVSPFGNVFLLARVIYDGPGMATLQRECATARWRLCSFLDRFPATSDEFLWSDDSPMYLAGGPKIVSREADAIIQTALLSDPAGEARSALRNTVEQLRRFDSGDGLEAWPAEVSAWIERDFPAREYIAYATARQQTGRLAMPGSLAAIHKTIALAGVAACLLLLPIALRRRADCSGFLLAVLLTLPLSAAITGTLSTPHDRYQSRIMWLPPFIATVSLASLRRHPA